MKRILIIICSSVVILLVAIFILAPHIISQEHISHKITEVLRTRTGYAIEYDQAGVGFFPLPSLELRNLTIPDIHQEFTIADVSEYVTATASISRLRCRIRLFPLLFGKVELAQLSFKGFSCDATLSSTQNYPLHNGREMRDESRSVALHVVSSSGSLVNKGRQRFGYAITASLDEHEGTVMCKGVVTLSSHEPGVLRCNGTILVEDVAVGSITPLANYFALPIVPEEGFVRGEVEFVYTPEIISGAINGAVDSVVYAAWQDNKVMRSVPLSGSVRGKMTVLPTSSIVRFTDLWVDCQGSLVRINGDAGYQEPYACDVSLYSEKTDLDALIPLFPMIQKHIPLNVGFSGGVRYDLTFRYGDEGIVLQSTVELDEARLSYGTVFAKPEGLPMSVRVVCESEGDADYEGDITVSLKDMNLKSTVTHFNHESGSLEGSFISNNFGLAGWEEFFPSVKGVLTDGQFKVFGSIKGNIHDLPSAQYSGGCVIENGAYAPAPTVKIDGVKASMKLHNSYFESRAIRARLNGELIEADVYAQFRPLLGYDVRVSGALLDLSFLDAFILPEEYRVGDSADEDVRDVPPAASVPVASAVTTVQSAVAKDASPADVRDMMLGVTDPAETRTVKDRRAVVSFGAVQLLGNTISDVSCVVTQRGARLVLEEGHAGVAGGVISLSGSLGFDQYVPPVPSDFGCSYEASDIVVQALALGNQKAIPMLEGVATMTGVLSGSVQALPQSLAGNGELAVDNGRLTEINFLDIIASVGRLFGADFKTTQFTDFSRAEYQYTIENQRLASDHILLQSSLYDMSGIGTVGFDQTINYSFNVLLNERLSNKMMSSLAPGERVKIPVYIYNTVQEPKYSVEKSVASAILNSVVNKGLEKLFGSRSGQSGTQPTTTSDGRSKPLS